MINDA